MGLDAGGADHTLAAGVYTAATALSWARTMALPGIQAAAQIKLLERQDSMYRNLRSKQRKLLDTSLSNYYSRLEPIIASIRDAYPGVPKHARYVPVDPCQVAGYVADCNQTHMQRAAEWASCVASLNRQADLARIVFFDPKWVENVDLYAVTVGDLLRGRVPVDYRKPLLEDASEQEAFEARMGGLGYRTARSYGLSEGRMRSLGRDELVNELGLLESVSPVGRAPDMRDLLQKPEQRIAFALTQAQLVQNSLQNVYNAEAQTNPGQLARINLRIERAINMLQFEASKANLMNSHVPNYAAVLQPQINALADGFSSFFENASANRPPVIIHPDASTTQSPVARINGSK